MPPPPEVRFYVFQLPFLRLMITGGNFSVSIFFLLSGFVCSIKSLRRGREGDKVEARNVASNSIARRVVRLIVPASVATILSWLCSQSGGYNVARNYGSPWMQRVQSPIPGFLKPIKTLLLNCVNAVHELLIVVDHLDKRIERVRRKSMDYAF